MLIGGGPRPCVACGETAEEKALPVDDAAGGVVAWFLCRLCVMALEVGVERTWPGDTLSRHLTERQRLLSEGEARRLLFRGRDLLHLPRPDRWSVVGGPRSVREANR